MKSGFTIVEQSIALVPAFETGQSQTRAMA